MQPALFNQFHLIQSHITSNKQQRHTEIRQQRYLLNNTATGAAVSSTASISAAVDIHGSTNCLRTMKMAVDLTVISNSCFLMWLTRTETGGI